MACASFVGKYLHTYSEYISNLWQLFETKTICYFLFNKKKILAWKRMITSPKNICKYELDFMLKTLQFNWEDAKFFLRNSIVHFKINWISTNMSKSLTRFEERWNMLSKPKKISLLYVIHIHTFQEQFKPPLRRHTIAFRLSC